MVVMAMVANDRSPSNPEPCCRGNECQCDTHRAGRRACRARPPYSPCHAALTPLQRRFGPKPALSPYGLAVFSAPLMRPRRRAEPLPAFGLSPSTLPPSLLPLPAPFGLHLPCRCPSRLSSPCCTLCCTRCRTASFPVHQRSLLRVGRAGALLSGRRRLPGPGARAGGARLRLQGSAAAPPPPRTRASLPQKRAVP